MGRLLVALASGALFGAGLLVSGMTDPAKVRGWLDVFGAWDPTLAFVLGGAILPMALAWRIAARMPRSLSGAPLPGPASRQIDARLLGGSALFGLGWAIAGYCPGPALASIGFGGAAIWIFTAAMLLGIGLHTLLNRRS
ncbi:DUF6691 family protein [Paracoccus aminophilus]|uniref:YeeE/YedE family protein n=1 Tax=Paracoccus aminophilus JCM 7686 TaxID=1367847 RepID=S5XVD6_PARAH|nr:DUF6691 family protein [Paracoccus aminophilus]AGT09212.1 hypothetical protein JCM7686_2131 [Paracoccus aminophilus JCM 7686]